jgi:recombination protein RecR
MAGVYDGAVQELIDELGRLPGVGPKSAQRIAFHILEEDQTDVEALAQAILRVKERVRFCEVCGNVTEEQICSICADTRRLDSVICVVEEARDIVAIERTREFRGRYHVLGGSINPIQGIGPEDLRIRELLARLGDGAVTEVILAMDPNIEGEATAAYLLRILVQLGVAVSRLASGLPVGGDLEYADEITLSRAFEGRQRVHTPTPQGAGPQGSQGAVPSATQRSVSSTSQGSTLPTPLGPATQAPEQPATQALGDPPAQGPATQAPEQPAQLPDGEIPPDSQ